MIQHAAYPAEPWCLRETRLDLDVLAQSESLFALANGHIGWRGNLDEGEPCGIPGSYLNGVFELRPLPHAEAGYGFPEASETVVNVTNGKVIRLFVDDRPFDVRAGQMRSHERRLDFSSGLLERSADWLFQPGRSIKVRSERLVSFVQRSVAAISYEVEALDSPVRVVLQSELVANEPLPPGNDDPRVAAAIDAALRPLAHTSSTTGVALSHVTRTSGLCVAATMDHRVAGPSSARVRTESGTDLGRVTVTATLEPGEVLRVVKFVTYGWSAERSASAVRDEVAAALTVAVETGWDGLVAEQRCYLDDFWQRSDIEIDGDPEIQQAVRFSLFHVLQAGARAESSAIPAKGLTGPGYDGHAFWDTETFVLPVLRHIAPEVVAQALRWRHSTLSMAKARASELGLEGAVFPWRTIAGRECSGYWPAGTAAFHIGADIADAVVRYVDSADDLEFERGPGLELLVETARMWRSLGHHDAHGAFRIDGVTGPDEYSAIADNNLYTNLMAQHNLASAVDIVQRHARDAARLGVDDREVAAWLAAADSMTIPYDDVLRVHLQAEGFASHAVWDFASTRPEQYPLLLHFPYFDLYRKQVVKQADLVLAMHLRGDRFTAEEKARNFGYYEGLTVRDSSLSAATQAVIAVEVGQIVLGRAYLREAALLDLDDLEHNTRDGLHVASLAGTWSALVAGFAGMRDMHGRLHFAPRLPEQIGRLAIRLCVGTRRLRITITPEDTRYQLSQGDTLEIVHDGEFIDVTRDEPTIRPTRASAPIDAPSQPHGRAPIMS